MPTGSRQQLQHYSNYETFLETQRCWWPYIKNPLSERQQCIHLVYCTRLRKQMSKKLFLFSKFEVLTFMLCVFFFIKNISIYNVANVTSLYMLNWEYIALIWGVGV